MNLDFTPEEHDFRAEVRAFFVEQVRPEWRMALRAGLRPTPVELTEWQQALAARGWGAPTWPKEFGGTGWTPTQLYIFESEAADAEAPIQFHCRWDWRARPRPSTYSPRQRRRFRDPRYRPSGNARPTH